MNKYKNVKTVVDGSYRHRQQYNEYKVIRKRDEAVDKTQMRLF